MKWQRARLLSSRDANGPPVSFLLWVVVAPPQIPDGTSFATDINGAVLAPRPGYRSNVLAPGSYAGPGRQIYPELTIDPKTVELLARGPEDFCEDPPRIRWGAWADGGPD